MNAELKPVTRESLGLLAKKTWDYGFPRGERWIERLLFDPNVDEGRNNPTRGAYVANEAGECVGMYCWYPCVVYHKQTRILAYSGALMGVDRKYSTYLFDLVDRSTVEIGQNFSFGNDCASVKAARFWTGYTHPTWGPDEGLYTDMRDRKVLRYWCGLLWRLHCKKRWAFSALFCLVYPYLLIENVLTKFFRKQDKDIRIVREYTFSDERFMPFWEAFLAANKGVVSSREPATLRWKFDEVLEKGVDVLLVAERNDCVIGYLLMRKIPYNKWPVFEYSICDICAIGNDEHCLKVLLRAGIDYCSDHMGVRIKYVGAPKNKQKWVGGVLPRHVPLSCNPFSYSGGSSELQDAMKDNDGWFFGPYDGERCMGYGAFLDI